MAKEVGKENTIAALGIKKGTKVRFKVNRGARSGVYPADGEGYVESFVRNGILIKTLNGYRVTIHDFDLACDDIDVTLVS